MSHWSESGVPTIVTKSAKPWWRPPWIVRREPSPEEEVQATVEAGGHKLGDDDVEGPNTL